VHYEYLVNEKGSIHRGFNRSQAPGKYNSCEEYFAHLVNDPLGKSFSLKEVQCKMFCPAVETSCPSGKNVYETPLIHCLLDML